MDTLKALPHRGPNLASMIRLVVSSIDGRRTLDDIARRSNTVRG